MKILITGGAGFIGSHTTVALARAGHEAVVLDRCAEAGRSVMADVEKAAGCPVRAYAVDLLDERALSALFLRERFDAVIHFAGLKAVGESVEKPLLYYHNNLTGTINLCRAMQAAGCRTLVFSSSATVYGTASLPPFAEDAPLSAANPYGQTKLMSEQILRDLSVAEREWSIVMLRYFNPVGAHESGLLGENPEGVPSNLFPYIVRVAAGLLPELQIFGGDYDTPDGTGVRDYIHIEDLAEGHLAAIEYAAAHRGIEAINLGSGRGISVLELVRAFERASGRPVPYRIVARRPGDVAVSCADVSKARRLLGWQPSRDVDAMCRDGWNYCLKQGLLG